MVSPVLFAGRVQLVCPKGKEQALQEMKAKLAERGIQAEQVAPHDGKSRPNVMVLMTGGDLDTYKALDQEHDKLLEAHWNVKSQIASVVQRITDFILAKTNVIRLNPIRGTWTDEQVAKAATCLQA